MTAPFLIGRRADPRPAVPIVSNIIPAAHLRAFGKALNPVVAVIGDSTTVGGGASTVLDFLYPALQAKIRRDNPGRTITFRNLSVGGKSWLSLPIASLTAEEIAASPDLAATGLTATSAWLDFAEFYAPDLLIINCGTNAADTTTPFRINDALVANVNAVATWAKQPSIILVTPNPRGSRADGGLLLAQNDREASAGAIRSYADFNGLGYIDLYRAGSIAKNGEDVVAQVLSFERSAFRATWPFTLPPTVDGEITFTIANPQACFQEQVGGGTARLLEIGFDRFTTDSPTTALTPASIRLAWGNSTRWRYQILGQSGLNTSGVVNTTVNLLTTPQTVRVSWKSNHLRIDIAGTTVFDGPWYRVGGRCSPRFSFTTGTDPFSVTIDEYRTSAPFEYQAAMADEDFYGTQGDETGGNEINHPASRGVNGSILRAVEAANFCGAEANVPLEQAITAAGAIDTRASYVRVTGPAASTYAITLAAPAATDIGRTMVIEMVATTGSNAVTLALTNVVGGTASTTASFDAARESLTLIAQSDRWQVLDQFGVTLT